MSEKRWIAETLFDELGLRMSYRADKVIRETRTGHQHLVLFKHPFFGKVLMLDGATQITERDEFVYLDRDMPQGSVIGCPAHGQMTADIGRYRGEVAATLAARYRKAGNFSTKYWTPEVHAAAFALPRFIAELVAKAKAAMNLASAARRCGMFSNIPRIAGVAHRVAHLIEVGSTPHSPRRRDALQWNNGKARLWEDYCDEALHASDIDDEPASSAVHC
jgi:hypothetical protein